MLAWPTFAIAIFANAQTSMANEEPDNKKMYALISSLEKRISQLESENRKYRNQLTATAQPREKANTANLPIAASRDSMASVGQRETVPNSARVQTNTDAWSGIYIGATVGGAITNSKSSAQETASSATPSNPFPFNLTGYSMSSSSAGSGKLGTSADLFVGFNNQINSVLVTGLQLEGSLSEIDFSSSGSRSYSYFDANGLTGMTANSDYRPKVHSRWMASALMRIGILVSPDTLIYSIGGISAAQFRYSNVTDNLFYQPTDQFYALGWNIGGGAETLINSKWSVRAEYRYTNFGTVTVQDNFSFNSSLPSSQNYTARTRFDNDMHMMRIGVIYRPNS